MGVPSRFVKKVESILSLDLEFSPSAKNINTLKEIGLSGIP